ncbi:MAG: LysM peptidoglycan-binding domain-containing protein [Gammaproteobacteria bacterium]|nr:LysM peptidoglycan-binding domain-containing protein [Gammaproteobacteria bacterium]
MAEPEPDIAYESESPFASESEPEPESEPDSGPEHARESEALSGDEDSAGEYRAGIDKRDQVITITLEGPRESPLGESLLRDDAPSDETGEETSVPATPDGDKADEAVETAVEDSGEGTEISPSASEPSSEEDAVPAPVSETDAPTESEAKSDRSTGDGETAEPAAQPPAEATPATPPVEQKTDTKPAKGTKRRVTHVVVKGDTLWDIAERYVKDPFRYPELARLSGIRNPDLIYPGDIVVIIEK